MYFFIVIFSAQLGYFIQILVSDLFQRAGQSMGRKAEVGTFWLVSGYSLL